MLDAFSEKKIIEAKSSDHTFKILRLHLHCQAACRCSPNSAGPSWPPLDTANIHKNRQSERRGGGSDESERQTCAGADTE